MIKKLVTISLITVGVLLFLIAILGMFIKQPNGKYGWQQLLQDRHGIFNLQGSTGTSTGGGLGLNQNSDGSTSNQNGASGSDASGSSAGGTSNGGDQSGSTSGGGSTSLGASSGGSTSNSGSTGSSSSGGSTSGSTTKPAPTPVPTSKPATPAPTPVPPKCTAGGSCTSAEVAVHNSAGNCWVIYGGKVYNVTSFVNNHPPGPAYFTSQTCGHDITAYMNGSQTVSGLKKHNHSSSAYSILNSYWYANLI